MKITSLEIKDYLPIKSLKMENLGDIVIIAGANGAGKTRLKEAIVQTLQGNPQMSLTVRSTKPEEKEKFGNVDAISVQQGQTNQTLNQYMQSRSFGRGRYVGSLIQIDSQRNIQTVSYQAIKLQVTDPDDNETPWNWGYQAFTNRWQTFMNEIHQSVAAYTNKLAKEVQENSSMTGKEILEKIPHPLAKYKEIFSQLLPGKELQDINPASPKEFQYKDDSGQILAFSSLSSGEQEIVKVIFDVVRKDIKHSIIIVDEPELHLHPTLTFKLVETLKSVGDHTNQFIFLTHSADLISTYYSTGDVYFIDSLQDGNNQAHKLSELNHSHKEVVQLIGENLGLFAVGKKLIFVEGENSSIDRLTYHKIGQKYLPDAKFIPVGSVENVLTLNTFEEQIRNSIFGINLFMIRDRDGLSDSQIIEIEKNGRIKCLKKRHIENYFFDSEILFKVAEKFYLTAENSELNKEFIEQKLKEIATSQIKLNLLQNTKEYLKLNHNFDIPTVKSLDSKDVESIKTEMQEGIDTSVNTLSDELLTDKVKKWMNNEQGKLEQKLQTDEWKSSFQGKQIFSIFCGSILKTDHLRIRQAYIDLALEDKPEVFDDIKDIFRAFGEI